MFEKKILFPVGAGTLCEKTTMKIVDAFDLLQSPPKPISYLLEGLIPIGTCGDLFGAPGDGKSSLTLDLLLTVASGKGIWNGLQCASGNVVILGGERSDVDSFQRDLHRTGKSGISRGSLTMPQSESGDSAIWIWNRDSNNWELTSWGHRVIEYLHKIKPVMTVFDTTMSVARGSDLLNNPQQYLLGEVMRSLTKLIQTTSISISHTNQSSSREEINWRLKYLSRSGGNGLPGSLRWLAGLSRLRPEDSLAKKLSLVSDAKKHWLIALGVSKNNEMPKPHWTSETPGIFQLNADGSLKLIMDGREVRGRLQDDFVSSKVYKSSIKEYPSDDDF